MEKRRIGIKCLAVLFLANLLCGVLPASAQEQSGDFRMDQRLQRIRQMISHDKSAADRWWYGWLIGYSAATIVQGAVGLSSEDNDTREDMAVGAATTFLGAIGQVVTPLVPGHYREILPDSAADTPEAQKDRLAKAEQFYRELAKRERNGKSWKMHALTGAVNLGSGLVVWLGFKRSFWEGVTNFLVNTAVTEIQIWTQPAGAIRNFDMYTRESASGSTMDDGEPSAKVFAYAYPGGIGIRVVF